MKIPSPRSRCKSCHYQFTPQSRLMIFPCYNLDMVAHQTLFQKFDQTGPAFEARSRDCGWCTAARDFSHDNFKVATPTKKKERNETKNTTIVGLFFIIYLERSPKHWWCRNQPEEVYIFNTFSSTWTDDLAYLLGKGRYKLPFCNMYLSHDRVFSSIFYIL